MANFSPTLLIKYNTQAFCACIQTEPCTASVCNALLSRRMIRSISQVKLSCSAISCFESCPRRFPAQENVLVFKILMAYKGPNTVWCSKKCYCSWYRLVCEIRERAWPSYETEQDNFTKCWRLGVIKFCCYGLASSRPFLTERTSSLSFGINIGLPKN